MIEKESSSDIRGCDCYRGSAQLPCESGAALTCFCMEGKSGTAAGMVSTLWFPTTHSLSMDGENWPLVADELAEFEKKMVRVQGFRRINNRCRRIVGIYLKLRKKNRKITTCNQFGLGNIVSNIILTNLQTFIRQWNILHISWHYFYSWSLSILLSSLADNSTRTYTWWCTNHSCRDTLGTICFISRHSSTF